MMPLARLRRRATPPLLGLLGLLPGCEGGTPACVSVASVAIRVRAREAPTGAALSAFSMSATKNGASVHTANILAPQNDPAMVQVFGGGGSYTLTVTKHGFIEVSQLVSVEYEGACNTAVPVDVTVTLQRAP